MFPVAERPLDTEGPRRHRRCCSCLVAEGLSIISGSVVTSSGTGWYCSLVIDYVRTTRRGRGEEGEERDIGCLTTITTMVLSFQNKTIYAYKTVTGTNSFKTHSSLALNSYFRRNCSVYNLNAIAILQNKNSNGVLLRSGPPKAASCLPGLDAGIFCALWKQRRLLLYARKKITMDAPQSD